MSKHIMRPVQAGYMAGMSTSGQIYRLESVIEHCRLRKEGIVCAFLDISKAFDTVKHSDLYKTMVERGIEKDIVSIVGAMYTGCEGKIIINERLS
ncbi:unnamed protein product [Blepharisma stoltei]|uniref:Reverse transcriptase domain-containing protein n=1 Tax=Blepharisma stoltei TaxID=1481888 RepID=A0AAU9KA81_9CILI|nr:unnamed protein product [Blepharisma stoltei]